MKFKHDIIIILDSIQDDYYYLWECYEDFKQNTKSNANYKSRFTEALKECYENKYFDFFIGEGFDGDEELIPGFELSDSAIEELLNYKNKTPKEIRLTTSFLGLEFLKNAPK